MLSRIRSFISRHRRKFFGMAVTGAIIWGGWTYFNWRMRKSEEDYVREVLNRAKRHMHHKSSAQAAEKQAVALIPVATKATNNALDTNAIVCELKGGCTDRHSEKPSDTSLQQPKVGKGVPVPLTSEERISKWDELKRVSLARAVAYAYVPSILIVFLRLQLGLLGGYVYRSCGGDNIDAFLSGEDEGQSKEEKQNSMPLEIQEAYLSLTQHFLEGRPSVTIQRQGNPFKGSQDNLSDSCWAEPNSNQNSIKGKGKLNLSFQSGDVNQTVGENNTFNSLLQSHDDKSSSVKCPVKLEKCDSKGESFCGESSGSGDSCLKNIATSSEVAAGGEGQSADPTSLSLKATSGMGDGAFKVASQENELSSDELKSFACDEKLAQKEKHASASVQDENRTVSPAGKDDLVPNGTPEKWDSSDSGTQGCELLHYGVADDETGDQKEMCVRESAEEDSGRCSGIDEACEEEVVEVKGRKSGIEMLCSLLENKVGRVADGTSLKMQLSLADTETLFWGALTSIRSNPAEDPAFNLPKYLLPSPEVLNGVAKDLEDRLDPQASALFLEMISETADLLETKEVVELVQSCVSAGLGHIMDRLANYFPQNTFSLGSPQQSPARSSSNHHIQGTSLQKTIPMAKLIPIISKVAFEDGSPWFRQLLEMSNLKDFGANVYEAFTR